MSVAAKTLLGPPEISMTPGQPGAIDLVLQLYTRGNSDEVARVKYSIHESPGFVLVGGEEQTVTVPGESTEEEPYTADEHRVSIEYQGPRTPPPPAVGINATVTVPGRASKSVVVRVVGIRWNGGGGS